MKRMILAVMLAGAIASPLHAQSWEGPSFFSPRAGGEFGGYLISPDHGDLGFMAIWRQTGNLNLGVRGGLGGRSGNRSALLGVEFFGPIVTPADAQPLALAWITGAGASFNGDFTWLRIPLGISIGAEIPGSSVTVTPYAHPRVALDIFSFDTDEGDNTDTELNIDADFGVDLAFGSAWIARFGLTVGQRDAFGIGLAYRIQRGVTVR